MGGGLGRVLQRQCHRTGAPFWIIIFDHSLHVRDGGEKELSDCRKDIAGTASSESDL